ncbi:O-antigen ligase family protein [Micromonospora chersina]
METLTQPARDPAPGAASSDAPATRIERLARHAVTGALALVAVKPLLDVGESKAGDALDVGVVVTVLGALLMLGTLAAVVYAGRRLPARPLLYMLVALVAMLVMSGIDYLAVPARQDLLELFDVRRYSIYGPHLEPTSAIPAEALRLVVGFAPLALLGLALLRPGWLRSRRLAVVAGVVVVAAVVHCVLAWLQVAGVLPYSFYFELPGQKIGRASGGYYHPMSLGRLLMFAVFLIYVLGDRLRVRAAVRYALIALFVATGVVSLHRFTIVCLAVIVVAFEARRLRGWRAGMTRRRLPLAVGAAVVVVAAVAGALSSATIRNKAHVTLTEVGSLDVRSDTFMHGRGAIWNDVAEILHRSPLDVWLFGFGYEPWDMHNDWLRVLVIWGVVGVGLTIAVLVGLYRLIRAQLSPAGRLPLAVLYATLVLFGLTQKPLAYPYFLWLFVFGAVLLISIDRETTAVAEEGGDAR